MTNAQIIYNEAIANGIYTEDEALEILEMGVNLPIHTYAVWQQLGYQVQKGQKAAIKTKLWKPIIKKAENEGEKDEQKMILVNASLFTVNQVEKRS